MKRLLILAMLSAVAVGGCVPVPIPGKIYVPVREDGTPPPKVKNTVCAANEVDKAARRMMGNVEISVYEPSSEFNNKDKRADFNLYFEQPLSSGQGVSIRVDPTRIKLEEAGRVLDAKMLAFSTYKPSKQQGRTDSAVLKFPGPSGVSNRVRLVFQPGAIRIGGRPVAMAPIEFKRISDPTIYFFPCIPS